MKKKEEESWRDKFLRLGKDEFERLEEKEFKRDLFWFYYIPIVISSIAILISLWTIFCK